MFLIFLIANAFKSYDKTERSNAAPVYLHIAFRKYKTILEIGK